MISKSVIINSNIGIHAKPATSFLKKIKKIGIPIVLEAKGVIIDGPSIMSILGLCLQKGDLVVLHADDAYAGELDELVRFIENDFSDSL